MLFTLRLYDYNYGLILSYSVPFNFIVCKRKSYSKNCLLLPIKFYELKNIITFLTIFVLLSCSKNKERKDQETDTKPLLSVVQTYATAKKISPIYKKEVTDWKELNALEDFLARFKKVSPKEILSNALEMEELAKALKTEKKPTLFDEPSLQARINILYNETLRLVDMTNIPAIKVSEINAQMKKIIDAFSAINGKINTILSKKRFEDAVDIDVKFIGLDSTKIDSVSKKSIDEKLQFKLEGKTKNQ